ncbi:outer membrane beta-barrel protein [Pedobacter rhodius]|uniref:Outer membrane beta-barrel protein n=1 Tax=Pedobacter rhodius TaxID=3004098 RepID=A0ABT4L2U9_9SPHI|nr:outer membrane beta-barrel protein [Pedobacter sp. SJ11]MCZ4225286.1 outer membrane beta-barrel protein [Pedobacter sp. SJ11]
MKRLLLSLSFLLISIVIFAQKSGSITGILADSANHKTTLNYSTVSVYKAGDSVLITYKLSDDKGIFKINNLQTGIKYRLVITAWQYATHRKEVELTAANPSINLGSIYLSTRANDLNEVNIVAERPPVIVRKDTIEFNAESFKTLPSAVVEDLLKKLPGVAIAADGSIQVNGKTVSKILVDGKEFFGGDQQIATKNLPANIIDKIQVMDDKEAKRADPDLLAVNTPQVINLKLKKAIKQGAFGKLYGGGGIPNGRFEAGGIMNFFRDTTQVSILGYGNNVNKPGFSISDIMRIGGMQRTGVNSMMVNSDGGYALNGISFGGAASGIQKSAGGGLNFNTLTKKGAKLNLKYFFGLSDQENITLSDSRQSLGTGDLLSSTNQNQLNKIYSHNLGGRGNFKLDSLNELTISPSVTINSTRNNGLLLTRTRNVNEIELNNGYNQSRTIGDNFEYQLSTNYWRDFRKNRGSLNTTLNLTKKDNFVDYYNNTISNFYNPNSTQILDQLRDNNIKNQGVYLSVNFTRTLSKKLSLTVATNANYLDNENALATFYKDPTNQAYDIAVSTLSQTVNQEGYKTNNRASLKWKANKFLTIQPGLVFNTINLENSFTSFPSFGQNFTFFAPSANIRYKDFSIDYTPSFREPDLSYIQPVANNTNPLYVQNGNPNLLPTKTHQVYLNLYKYDVEHTLNYNAYGNASIDNNAVIMSRIISSNGLQTSTPINVDGIIRLNAGLNFSKDIKKDKRQITLGTGFYTNFTRNLVQVNDVRSYAKILNFSPSVSGKINLNDKLEISTRYNLGINNSRYDDSYFTNINYFTHLSDSELILRLPKKLVWETTYRINYNTQTVAGFNNKIQIWNASLTYLFMKNDRAQLKFSVNDILNTNIRRYVSITENSIRDTRYNNLGRYALLTFTYNIQNFGGKVGGKDTFFRF